MLFRHIDMTMMIGMFVVICSILHLEICRENRWTKSMVIMWCLWW